MSIYCERLGGLGNQLFIVAAAYSYSKKHNVPLYISENTSKNRPNFNDNIFKHFDKYQKIKYPVRVYTEPYFNYSEIPKSENILIKGYFQSEKYFKDHSTEIKELFTFPTRIFLPETNLPKVACHVRRSDYLNFSDIHTVQPLSYYSKATKLLKSVIGDFHLVIFSDDANYCKEHFKGDAVTVIESDSSETATLEDFYNMSLCDHFIIANSSFSFWASYISKSNDKIIIAPKKWFGQGFKQDFSDIYSDSTILL